MTAPLRFVAFLRGVSPMNATMPALRQAFESAGFRQVRTVLASGNVAFSSDDPDADGLRHRAEASVQAVLGRRFEVFVRRSAELQALLASDPFAAFDLPAGAKKVVTFLRTPPDPPSDLPFVKDGVHLLRVQGREVLCAYVPRPGDPAFMRALERRFGRDITTRSLDTVRRCATA